MTSLPLESASVDLVVSFETIEHLAQQEEMLAEFRRVLAPDGILVVSSPNKPVCSGDGTFRNAYHVQELTREELADLLQQGFPRQRWYRQRPFARSTLWIDDARGAGFIGLPAMYFVVVCGGAEAVVPASPSARSWSATRRARCCWKRTCSRFPSSYARPGHPPCTAGFPA